MGTDELERGTGRATNINRAGRMVLHPLAEIGIGVFVSVRISGSQLMMDVLGYCKRGQYQKKQDEAYRKSARDERMSHEVAIDYHKAPKPVKINEYSCVFPDIPICYARPCRLFLSISLCCATSSLKGRP